MKYQEELIPNELLRHARNLIGWSQAELAEKVGTSFEMVSRWERGVTVPSLRYRRQLCAILGKSAEELGLIRDRADRFTPPSSPLVLFASSHVDAEKAPVPHLLIALQERGISLWSNHQSSKQITGSSRTALHKTVQGAQAILIIVSPEAHSSRHVREAFEMARRYRRPVYGVWIEGEHWEHCLPEDRVELAALIDARERKMPSILEEIALALEQVGCVAQNGAAVADPRPPDAGTEGVPVANEPTEMHLSKHSSEQAMEHLTLQSQSAGAFLPPRHSSKAYNGVKPTPITLPLPTTSSIPGKRKGQPRTTVVLLIGVAILVIAGGIIGSYSLLIHYGVIGTNSGATAPIVVRGGTWTYGLGADVDSLIPNGGANYPTTAQMDQALYLPLFYGDAQGVIHPGAAAEIPTVQNGEVNANATTWTFRLRPHLVWSDGQPYDARDVNFTWKLWSNPKFGAVSTLGLDLISSATVSGNHLAITFHLKHPFAPFLADMWTDGFLAPLPEHHFITLAPEAILKSPDNLNPMVTSGPFMMSESEPGNHYTLVRNPHYYRSSEGLPYLDKVVFTIGESSVPGFFKDLQSGSLDASGFIILGQNADDFQQYQRLKDYTIVYPPALNSFEALYFNFHNTVLASHLEVRQAIAMAVDQQAIIAGPLHGFGEPLCTDHPSAYHPGYEPLPPCPLYDLVAANKLLNDNGWVKGSDGVRSRDGQRLEFEYSTTNVVEASNPARLDVEKIMQGNLQKIGIKLDIQNYPGETFFGSLLPQGKASPPSGAIAGRYDIAEFSNSLSYDPDDSSLFSCDQFPPRGFNINFYCNPTLDALYAQEQTTADAGVRQQIFIQIHRIYLTQFPFIVLYSPNFFGLVRKGTHNYQQGPVTDTYNIAEWWCENGQC